MPHELEIDALGLLCPLPVLRIQKQMRRLAPGDTVKIISDDPAALVDIPHYCKERGHALVQHRRTDKGQVFIIRKA